MGEVPMSEPIHPRDLPARPDGSPWPIDENGVITEEGPFKGRQVKFSRNMRRYIRHLAQE